jgi:hypothetical protein
MKIKFTPVEKLKLIEYPKIGNRIKRKESLMTNKKTEIKVYKAYVPWHILDTETRKTIFEQRDLEFNYYNELIKLEQQKVSFRKKQLCEISPELTELYTKVGECDNEITKLYDDRRKLKRNERKQFSGNEALKEKFECRKNLYKKISKLSTELDKKYFDNNRKAYKEERQGREAEAAAKLGKSSLGPNSAEKRAIKEALDIEYSSSNDASSERNKFYSNIDEKVKIARKSSGLPDGTYNDVSRAVTKAVKDSFGHPEEKKRGQFRTSHITIQTTESIKREDGSSTSASVSWHKLMSYSVISGIKFSDLTTEGKKTRYSVSIEAVRRTVKLSFPVQFHRMPPDDSIISKISLVTNKVNGKFYCELQITAEHQASFIKNGDGRLVVDLDCSGADNAVRTAIVCDNGENTSPLWLGDAPSKACIGRREANPSHRFLRGMKNADHIESVADHIADGVVELFANYVLFNNDLLEKVDTILEKAFNERQNRVLVECNNKKIYKSISNIRSWKNPGRLIGCIHTLLKAEGLFEKAKELYHEWSVGDKANGVFPGHKKYWSSYTNSITGADRFPCESDRDKLFPNRKVFEAYFIDMEITNPWYKLLIMLFFWSYKHKHLVDMSNGLRRNAEAARNKQTEQWVSDASKKYNEVIVVDLTTSTKTSKDAISEADAAIRDNKAKVSKYASRYTLKSKLKTKFGDNCTIVTREGYIDAKTLWKDSSRAVVRSKKLNTRSKKA